MPPNGDVMFDVMSEFDFEEDVPSYHKAIRRMSPKRDLLSLSRAFEGACEIEINFLVSDSVTQRQGSIEPIDSMDDCAAKELKRRLNELKERYDGARWEREKFLDDYWRILEEGRFAARIFECICDSCQRSRNWASQDAASSTFNQAMIENSRRLFAISVLMDQPFLVCRLSSNGYDDAFFYCCDNLEELVRECQIPEDIATIVFEQKSLFFGRNIARYIRSSRRNDFITEDAERRWMKEQEWLMKEMLEIAKIMADPDRASQRKFLENGGIGDLTFTTHSGMDFLRRDNISPSNDELSLQSFGFLLLDITFFFLYRGGEGVLMLDRLRKEPPIPWFKEISEYDIQNLCKNENSGLFLGKAFNLARALIQQQGLFGLDPEINYEHCISQLINILKSPMAEDRISQDEGRERRRSTFGSIKRRSKIIIPSEEEIGEAHFRWLSLYYENENNPVDKGSCWIRVSKKTSSGDRLNFSIYPFCNPNTPIKSYASLKSHSDLLFIPLYAFHPDDQFSEDIAPNTPAHRFKVQYKDGDGSYDGGIHFVFTAQNREDAVETQKALTKQSVKIDKCLAEFSVTLKKKSTFSEWTETLLSDGVGTLQIWPAMTEEMLGSTQQKGKNRLSKPPKVWFEIALFSRNKLFILDIKSQPRIQDVTDSELRIRAQLDRLRMPGKLLKQEGLYPGLPLFKDANPKIWKGGEDIDCVSIQLRLRSRREKENLKTWFEEQYRAEIPDR